MSTLLMGLLCGTIYCDICGRIIINGGSNGGLLVAACANQRPDLFGCVVAQVGSVQLLCFFGFVSAYFGVDRPIS